MTEEQGESIGFDIENNIAVKRLRSSFNSAILDVSGLRDLEDEVTVRIKKEGILEIMKFLRDDEELQFEYLSDLCAVDNQDKNGEDRFEIVYHLFSIKKRCRIRIKISLRDGEGVNTVCSVWKTANWHEREAYDLMGIEFNDHPDLRRILLPEDWKGHPFRKEYPVKGNGEYGIS